MIDLIRIKNNHIKLNQNKFGSEYNRSSKRDGTQNYKYKLYKRDLQVFQEEDEFGNIVSVQEQYSVNDHPLALTINTKRGFTIYGSIRKWWYGAKSANADFSHITFCRCIKLLAKKIGVKETVLWSSTVNKVEIGGNIKLDPVYKNIVGALQSYPRRKRFGDSRETVYFKTKSNFDQIIIYDKITQLYSHKKISGNVKRKLLNSIFIMRFEIKLLTPSKTGYWQYINSLEKIRLHWDILIDDWEATFQKINIINQTPPKLPHNKDQFGLKEFKNYFIQLGIEAYGGIESVEQLISEKGVKNKRSEYKNNFRVIANANNIDEFVDFLIVLYTSIEGKADEMKRKFMVGVNNI